MTAFRYRAMTPAGKIVTGLLDASSEAAVVRHLRRLGNYPISTRIEASHTFHMLLPRRGKRLPSIQTLARTTQELASLLAAGVELDRALGILINLQGMEGLKAPLANIRDRIRDGAPLAEALSHHKFFPRFYVSAVRAGEHGGDLENTLARLGDYLVRSAAVRDNIMSALVYPSILMATAGSSILFILLVVLPQFEPLFENAGRSLPLSTRIVIGIADALAGYWWLIASVFTGLFLWIRRALRVPAFRLRFDTGVLRLPLFGGLILAAELERFFRTFGTLLSNGVALPSALAIASDTVTNARIGNSLRDAASRLREGERLADRLQRTGLVPAVALDLVRIGEETGKLDAMLLRQADLDAQRLKRSIDRFLALLVPALTILLGFVVAALIASMLVALLSVNDLALQ